MANKIDVKAEAERIIEEPRVNTPCGKCDEQVADIIALASRVRDEAIRETVDRCIAIVKQQFAAGRRPEIERVLRQAFAEPGKEQEPSGDKARCVKFVFDERSLESVEKLKEQGRYDVSLEKDPYTVTCVKCSARVHISDAVPETPNPESDPVCHECMEKMIQAGTLRQFVDAAVEFCEWVGPVANFSIDAKRDTILRLAPQFKEKP